MTLNAEHEQLGEQIWGQRSATENETAKVVFRAYLRQKWIDLHQTHTSIAYSSAYRRHNIEYISPTKTRHFVIICLSVGLSVCHMPCMYVCIRIGRGHPSGASNTGEMWICTIFRPISRCVSETVQDRDIVTMVDYSKFVSVESRGHGWPWVTPEGNVINRVRTIVPSYYRIGW